jgi:hypothetical protein
MTAAEIFNGSDRYATKAYYRELTERGPLGIVAMNLFRAQKCSSRAKVYRGGIRGRGSFKSMAYERKQWSMAELVKTLMSQPHLDGIVFGWKRDEAAQFGPEWVLYVDLPQGQVSFHSPGRGEGPDYPGDWDRKHRSEKRILAFCDSVMKAPPGVTQAELEAAGQERLRL